MDLTNLSFNGIDENTARGGFDPLPKGWYEAIVESMVATPTKSGSGVYLKTQFQIIGGAYANRKLFHNLNVKNDNETAQKIGLGQLYRIANALGYARPEDAGETDNLCNKPLMISVSIKKSDQYGDQNIVTDFKAYEGKKEFRSNASEPKPHNAINSGDVVLAGDDDIPF